MESLLYHYTSIDRLAQILKYRTIRLSPLDRMDDLQENKTKDIQNLGRFFFASCWTDDEQESIPMWNMYTDIKAGVRIGLPKNPFARHLTTVEEMKSVYGAQVSKESHDVETFLNIASLIKAGVFSPQAWGGDILRKIEYTDNVQMLEPTIATIADGRIQMDMASIGVYKNVHWEFQNEWRYLMMFLPLDLKAPVDTIENQMAIMINRLYLGELEPPFDHFDLSISDDAMSQMVITPSPKMTDGSRIILDTIVSAFNPSATIKDSSLVGKI